MFIERDNSSRIPRRKKPIPMYKDNQNENMMRKAPSKNSTKDRFPVIPQTLKNHYRDPRSLSDHQNLPKKQATNFDVRDCSSGKRVCTHLVEGENAYIRDCQEKTRIYVSKTQLG